MMKNYLTWDSLEEFGQIPAGTKVAKGAPLFPRLDVEKEVAFIQSQMKETDKNKRERRKGARRSMHLKSPIDDFSKVQLKVAEVIAL